VVADGDAADIMTRRLRPRIKQLAVLPLDQALGAVEQRRYDEIVVVAPPNTVSGSQQLATLAARAKNGVVIFTDISDFARLPGVRQAVPLPTSSNAVCEQVAELLRKRAHGE
jgi:class 3 adenylate cyclase